MEITTKTDNLDYATTDFLQQQASEVITIHIFDDNMSNAESSATDSTVTNDGVDNSINTKNLDDAAMVPGRTDMIAQVTIVQTENNKYWECDICQKMFFWKCHLARHKLIHVEKQYKCEVCDKKYSTPTTLKIHMRIHTGEKPFICGLCEKTFSSRDRCSNHQRTHTGVKPYTYKICDKTEKLIWKKLGRSENSYQCPICHEMFVTTAGLNRHKKRLHFNESDKRMFVSEKFPCGMCGKKFADLDYHMLVVHPDGILETHATRNKVSPTKRLLKVHEQEKFKCDICGEVYHNRNQLTKHKQRHARKKMPCSQCGTFFIQQHLPQPWEIIKCKNCKSKRMTKYCADCKSHTNLYRNHCCRTYQKRKMQKGNMQLKKCGEKIKNGDAFDWSMLKKFALDLKDLSVISKISCDVCKRNFQSGRFHAIGLHCCGTLKEIVNMFESLSNSANNKKSTGCSAVDNNIPPPPAFGSNSRWQKIVEIRERGNTGQLNSSSEHFEDSLHDEIVEAERDAIDFIMPMTTEPGKDVDSNWEKSIMQEIFHIKQEINDS